MSQVLDSTKSAILEAADRLFEQYGYKKTTIEEIAQEAGIGKGSVYLHFASKEQIGAAWLDSLLDGMYQALTSKPKEATLKSISDFCANRVLQRFDLMSRHRRGLDEAVSQLSETLEDRKCKMHSREAEYLSNLIQQAVNEGVCRSEDPLSDARAMIVATNALILYNKRPDKVGTRDFVLTEAQKLTQFLLRAIAIP